MCGNDPLLGWRRALPWDWIAAGLSGRSVGWAVQNPSNRTLRIRSDFVPTSEPTQVPTGPLLQLGLRPSPLAGAVFSFWGHEGRMRGKRNSVRVPRYSSRHAPSCRSLRFGRRSCCHVKCSGVLRVREPLGCNLTRHSGVSKKSPTALRGEGVCRACDKTNVVRP